MKFKRFKKTRFSHSFLIYSFSPRDKNSANVVSSEIIKCVLHGVIFKLFGRAVFLND